MRPLIGITVGEIINKNEAWSPVVYGQSRTYVDAIIHAGGIPLILPLVNDDEVLKALYDRCDGLLLAGGNDPDPALYGAETAPLTVDVSVVRDTQELALLKLAMADNKPVLGICRGMQLINIAFGGSLYQDIATDQPGSLNHNASSDKRTLTDTEHTLTLVAKTKLANILERQQIGANAHHHQAVNKLADGLIANAHTEDTIIEGLESTDYTFLLGVQPHPESLEAAAEPAWRKLFTAFVAAAKP